MNMGMSLTHVALNVAMAVVGGVGGFFLGRLTAKVAREDPASAPTQTGTMRIMAKQRRWGRGQWIGGIVVAVVLLLLASGAITQSLYDNRLKCNSAYIQQFQDVLKANTSRTLAANNAQLAYIDAQQKFLKTDPTNGEGLRDYIRALDAYQATLVKARNERQPYPAAPDCENEESNS